MTLIKEKRASNNNMEPETTESEGSPGDRVNANVASKLQIIRPRELHYFGPVSVIPNTTYIRRLEHKGLLIPESKGCVLPALTSKTNAKRKKLDLPGVKNHWSCSIKGTLLFRNINVDERAKELYRETHCVRDVERVHILYFTYSVNG